ncbi:MAG: hypothetical protein QGI45_13370 [Myxococcota bacterium]|nr:hypothetical protein [Myxococcota bacterium]
METKRVLNKEELSEKEILAIVAGWYPPKANDDGNKRKFEDLRQY